MLTYSCEGRMVKKKSREPRSTTPSQLPWYKEQTKQNDINQLTMEIPFVPRTKRSHINVVAAATFLLGLATIVGADVTVSPEINPKEDARIVVLKGSIPGVMQEFCLAAISDDPYKGSKLKLAACKADDDKQLFLVDKNRWRLAADPTLCVDSNQTRMGASLYLQKCRGGENGNERQKWRFGSIIRAGAHWGMCPALAIGTPKPGAPVKMSECSDEESSLFYFEMPASITGEICRTCEDLYDVDSDDICKIRENRYCQFYVDYDNSDGNCEDYCKKHGGRCKRSYLNDGKCGYTEEVGCGETMYDGICRCSLPANCIHSDEGQDILTVADLDPSKYYHIVPSSCPFCAIYNDEGESDKIVARDRGRFAINTNFCNNGSFSIQKIDREGSTSLHFRSIHKFDNSPSDECLAWTEDWWCTDDDEPTVGELTSCNDGDEQQLWYYDEETLAMKSAYDDSVCLEYGEEIECAVGNSIKLRTCDSEDRQKWYFMERTCAGE